MLKLYLRHWNVLNLYFSKLTIHLMITFLEILLINIEFFRSIFIQLSPDMICIPNLTVFYLNSQIWQVFHKIFDTIFTAPLSLSDEKYKVGKKTLLMLKIATIVAFSLTKSYATKYSPLKTLHSIQNFSSFYTKICILQLIMSNLFC